MKVLIVAPNFGTFGGCEAFVFRLAQELVRHGVTVRLCFKRVKGGFELDDTMKEYLFASPASYTFVDRASSELWNEMKWADLVHAQNPSIDVAVFARLLRKPFVMTVHGWLRDRWSLRGLLSRVANRLADRRWYNSDFVWEKWEGDHKLPSSGKLPIVSNLPEGPAPYEERSGFAFAARWVENKGLDVLVRAYARADLDRTEWPLILLGDGPLRSRIEALIDDLGVDGIDIRGFVDEDTRDDVIRHAKWMVIPPHTDEDLGLTPIEARHVKVPCIITRDGGLLESGGTHALKCEPGAVEGLAQRLEEAAAMQEAEYRRISEATHSDLLEYLQPMSLYLDHYRDLLLDKGREVAVSTV
jgi:glycosyltransferase involved in cell wall biosynthesis